MRTISRLGRALTLAALLPAAAAAQRADASMDNSWYWGAGGGRISFPTVIHRVNAPMISADWLITRHRWALDIYGSQAYFTDTSTAPDPNVSGVRKVTMTDLRRFGFQGVVFLPNWTWFRPYAGAGYSFNFISQARPVGVPAIPTPLDSAAMKRTDDARARTKVTVSAGFMATWRDFAPYAQYTMMPTKGDGQWLINGDGFTSFWEVGLRYRFGSSIEKLK
jgi:hypothetical protein